MEGLPESIYQMIFFKLSPKSFWTENSNDP